MHFDTWLAFATASLVLLLIPGPTVLLVLTYAISHGRRVALAPRFTVLIATFVGLAALNALTYAILADRLRRRIARPAVLPMLNRLGGGVLIAMGVATAAARRSAS